MMWVVRSSFCLTTVRLMLRRNRRRCRLFVVFLITLLIVIVNGKKKLLRLTLDRNRSRLEVGGGLVRRPSDVFSGNFRKLVGCDYGVCGYVDFARGLLHHSSVASVVLTVWDIGRLSFRAALGSLAGTSTGGVSRCVVVLCEV